MMDLLASKKFRVMLGAILTCLAGGLTDSMAWGQAIIGIVSAMLVYIGAQGVADLGKAAEVARQETLREERAMIEARKAKK